MLLVLGSVKDGCHGSTLMLGCMLGLLDLAFTAFLNRL